MVLKELVSFGVSERLNNLTMPRLLITSLTLIFFSLSHSHAAETKGLDVRLISETTTIVPGRGSTSIHLCSADSAWSTSGCCGPSMPFLRAPSSISILRFLATGNQAFGMGIGPQSLSPWRSRVNRIDLISLNELRRRHLPGRCDPRRVS